jgi:activator of HSP90 ATPase
MANAIYPEYKEFLLGASTNVSLTVDDTTDGPFCALVDTGTYSYSSAHDFFNDLSGIVGTDQRITAPTVANGTFDGGDLTYTSVSGASVEALVIYRKNAGANTTWKLVVFIDTSVTGLPVTPNGGNITVTWNASGIFTL